MQISPHLCLLLVISSIMACKTGNIKIDDESQTIGNPVLPGYFADPTIKKFGDIYYIYTTTDNEMLASGAPTVWYSRDLHQWYNYIMEVPSLNSVSLRNFWAPDILEGKDGRYYLYFGNCQAGCNIYGYVSDTPVGPWTKLSEADTPVIAHHYPREGFPSLDAQFFQDSDGQIYAHWGTWVHYNNGYAVGKLDTQTMKEVTQANNIPLEQTPEPFEAAYMMKKGKKYILMYSGASCHDETYHVRYSYGDSPYGPFTPGENNPILSTNEDQTVHGPGHHSVLLEGDQYYIVYHKHDYPMTRGGLSRQVCIDRMEFENDSTIRKVAGTLKGVDSWTLSETSKDLAYKTKVNASSTYRLQTPGQDYIYQPDHVTDHNNATSWMAGNNTFPQSITLDLGTVQKVARIMTEFEFSTYYYQYRWEYSSDGKDWQLFADRSDNRVPGSPMLDDNEAELRYLRLTVLGTEMTGMYAAVWNVKVYSEVFDLPLSLQNQPSRKEPGAAGTGQQLFQLDAAIADTNEGTIPNPGALGGNFVKSGNVKVTEDEGIAVFKFENGAMILDQDVPKSLEWNGSYTVAAWVKNPDIAKDGECLVSWCDRFEFQLANSYNAMHYNQGNFGAAAHLDHHFDMRYNTVPPANTWHHIALTFDGVVERIYVNGVLDNAQKITLASAIDKAKIRVGASDIGEHYTGYLASVEMYDIALDEQQIMALKKATNPKITSAIQ